MKKKVLAILIATSMLLGIAIISGVSDINNNATGIVAIGSTTTNGGDGGIDPPGW